ncbi:MAG: J domain-containing protein [Labilithrix sp.]|nr:J domain-containing protein [Labilithrix sp.]
MTDLAAAVCSIALTKRRRFFWAAWWTAAPIAKPFRKPDASHGGAATREDALAEAEAASGRSLVVIDGRWARAWSRILRGQEPWTARDAKGDDRRTTAPTGAPSTTSIWTTLGVPNDATVADIKAAFRKRALETHPDHGGDPARFTALKRAYEKALARREEAERRPRRRRA